MNRASEIALKFPCDCFTESQKCEEPWALIAKRGIFKGGTKEKILNLIHKKPRTIAQLSESLEVSQPTIHKHLNGLMSGGLIAPSDKAKKEYPVERYYKPAFPVITLDDQQKLSGIVNGLAADFVKSFSEKSEIIAEVFEGSDAKENGWTKEEISQYILQAASRKARQLLEEKKLLASNLRDSENGILFWATTE